MSKADLGVSASGSDQQYLSTFYRLTNGEPRVVYGFKASGQSCQIWDFGLSNSVSRVRTIAPGLPPVRSAVIPTPVNSVVFGTHDPGHLWEYFPDTGDTNYIKTCSNRDYYSGALGTDGILVFGTFGVILPTAVETYNSETQTATEWGKLDPDQSQTAYVYSVGADSGAIYGAIYHSGSGEFYLGTKQKSDGATQVFWKGGASAEISVAKGTGDNNWYAQQITNSITRYWQLNGTNYPTLLGGNPSMYPAYKTADYNRDPDTWLSEEGWQVESSFAVVEVAGSVPQASARWRKNGVTDWTTVTETNGWLIGPYMLLKLIPYGNQFIWTADSYGPIGYMNVGGSLTLVASQAGLSWYDLLVSDASNVYLAGYHNTTKRWNPLAAWTYSISSSDTDPTVNPHFVVHDTLGKYHYYLAKANNGKIYIGSHHERGSTGGELGWYDPSDDSTGEDRTTFSSYDVRDLKPASSASKMVYVSSASDGKVFIWDVATDTVDASFSPLGSVVLDKVVEYETGKLFGITGTTTFAFTTAGALLWQSTIPATAWNGMQAYDHRITLGPDGYIWQCAGGNLYRISTADGSYTSLLSTTTDFNTVFLGTDLYLYGGTGGTKIWKVANALTQLASLQSTTIRAFNLKGR